MSEKFNQLTNAFKNPGPKAMLPSITSTKRTSRGATNHEETRLNTVKLDNFSFSNTPSVVVENQKQSFQKTFSFTNNKKRSPRNGGHFKTSNLNSKSNHREHE